MMIQIYDKSTTEFNRNGRPINNIQSCYITEELNGEYELELEHPIDAGQKWQELTENNIIKADGQLFRIYRKQKTLIGIKVNARHIFYDLLDNILEDVRPTNLNGAGALDWILSNTQYPHQFTSMSDISNINTKYFIHKSVVEGILGEDGLIKNWGGELVRDNFSIKLLQARGLDRGVLISYGKNIQGIEETLDMDGICTRLMPVGFDGLLLPEKYIDSPYINSFPHPKIRVVEFSDCEDESTLRVAAQKYMLDNQIDIPTSNYKIDFLELTRTEEYKNYNILESVYLGDTVTVKHSKLNINLKCKVIKITKNILTNRIEKVELGSFKGNIASSINNSIQEVKKDIVEAKNSLQDAIDSATIQINSALGGYVVKRNGELLIMDTQDVMTAQKIWRWNVNGLGYSSTGYNGPYRTAITADGHFVADFIDTGTLTAELIKTGVLKSFNNVSWLNMTNGTFNFANKITFDGNNFSINADAVKIAVGQIGGNNQLKNSSFEFNENYTKNKEFYVDTTVGGDTGYPASLDGGKFLRLYTTGGDSYIIKEGTPMQLRSNIKYTISFDYACSGNYDNSSYIYADGIPVYIPLTIIGDAKWHRFSWTFSLNRDGVEPFLTILRFGFNPTSDAWLLIDRVKIEEGENATAWSPHSSEIKNAVGEFTDEHFRVSFQDGSYSEMNNQGFKWHKGSTSKDYHYLITTGRCITLGTETGVVWVQLPDEFKGKDFRVTVAVEDSYNAGKTSSVVQKLNTYVVTENIDYVNARVPIFGYCNVYNVSNGTLSMNGLGISWTAIA